MGPLPLLQHIKPTYRQRHEYAIVATFNANLRFFEQRVLPNLRASRVLFLMDAGQHRLMLNAEGGSQPPQLTGIQYQVAPVNVPRGVFHSKLILCLSESRSRLVLGSGNMSREGYMSNAELFSIVESGNDPDDGAATLVGEACDFLDRLSKTDLVLSRAQEFIQHALRVRPTVSVPDSGEQRLLHSLEQPIIDQVAAQLGGQLVREIHILEPFHDANAQLVHELVSRFNHPEVHLYVQAGHTQLDVSAMEDWTGQYGRVKLYEISAKAESHIANFAQSADRYIHAKLLGFVTPSCAYSLTGSPNFTRAALGADAANGNVETALWREHSGSADLRKLFDAPFLEVRQVDSWSELRPEPPAPWEVHGSRSPLQILRADYSSPRLAVEFSYSGGNMTELSDFEILIRTPGGKTLHRLPTRQSIAGHLSVDCDLQAIATLLWLQAKKRTGGRTLQSEGYWISFPQGLETSGTQFGEDDFVRCAELGGLAGVQQALAWASSDQQSDWLIAFLQTWNLSLILESQNAESGGGKQPDLEGRGAALPLTPKEANLRRGLEILLRTDFEDVLQDLLEDYREKVKLWLEDPEPESLWMGIQFTTVFDLLCLLVMHGFERRIALELENKKAGLQYPLMQYGHVREAASRFAQYYRLDWKSHLEKGNLAFYSIRKDKVPNRLALFHQAEAIVAYKLASAITLNLDLETPVDYPPLQKACSGLMDGFITRRALDCLQSPDGAEVLQSVLSSLDLVIRLTGISVSPDQLEAALRDFLRTSLKTN